MKGLFDCLSQRDVVLETAVSRKSVISNAKLTEIEVKSLIDLHLFLLILQLVFIVREGMKFIVTFEI